MHFGIDIFDTSIEVKALVEIEFGRGLGFEPAIYFGEKISVASWLEG